MIGPSEKTLAPVRWTYLACGVGFVGFGVIGAILPVMPSTIFFILALWCFKRSSPRLERRLLEHPVIGPTLRDWDRNGSIKRRTKVIAVSMIWACLLVSALFVHKAFVYGILGATGIGLTWYLLTRPNAD